MGAPSYNNNMFMTAALKYGQLEDEYRGTINEYKGTVDEYTGEKGWNKATEMASDSATKAGQVAGSNAVRAARTAGMSKSTAAIMGANASRDTTLNSYQPNLNSALQNNSNTVSAKGKVLDSGSQLMNNGSQLMNVAAQQDTNRYNSAVNKWGAGTGMVGGVLHGVAAALSDEDMKCIKEKTNTRCDELIGRLKGGNK